MHPEGAPRPAARLADALVFSSLWVALAAVALAAAASRAMQVTPPPGVLGLALCGTLVVYTLDRLRDLDRDRRTAPERSAFVERHRRGLAALAAAAGAGALALGLAAGARVVALAAVVAAFGLAHRRLKALWWAKPAYLTLAWTAVAVGLPAAAHPRAQHVLPVAGVIGLVVLSNVVLSNLRDREGGAARLGPRRARALAAAVLVPAATLALAGPPPLAPLLALPLAMAAAVAGFRPTERYGAFAVDGALLLGALVALAL